MKRPVKRIIWIIVALGAVALLVWAFMPEPIVVDLARIERGPMQVTVNQEGKTRVRDRYVISAPLAGEMSRIELKAGDAVKANETLLAVIQPALPALLDARTIEEAQARVRVAEAAVTRAAPVIARAEAELENAKRQLERRRELAEQRAVSQFDLEQRELAVRVAEAEVNAARAAEDIARFQLEQAKAALLRVTSPSTTQPSVFEIRAPIDGQVLRVLQESQGTVAPGTPLLELGDVQRLEAVIDVLSQDAVKIRPGTRVYLDRWGGERPITGTVRRIEPSGFTKISALGVEEQRVNVIVDFAEEKDQALLGDQYRVDARIVVWEAPDVSKVESGALFRQGDDWAVYVVAGEVAQLRRVRIGRISGLEAEVIEGLSPGDRVISHPSDRVGDGVPVTPRPTRGEAL